MKIKSILIAITMLGLGFFPSGAINNSATPKEPIKIEVKQQNSDVSFQNSSEILNESTNKESSFQNSSSFVSESSSQVSENKILTDEEIEDIVKQVSNAIIGEELTDKLFAVFGSGILVIIGLVVVFQVYERKKNREVGTKLVNDSDNNKKEVNKSIDKLTAMVKEYDTIVDNLTVELEELRKINNELIIQNSEIVKDYEAMVKQMHEDMSKMTSALSKYSKIDNKLNAILKVNKELSKTKEFVKDGVTEKVNNIVKGVE